MQAVALKKCFYDSRLYEEGTLVQLVEASDLEKYDWLAPVPEEEPPAARRAPRRSSASDDD